MIKVSKSKKFEKVIEKYLELKQQETELAKEIEDTKQEILKELEDRNVDALNVFNYNVRVSTSYRELFDYKHLKEVNPSLYEQYTYLSNPVNRLYVNKGDK